jgi:hypothetical protein
LKGATERCYFSFVCLYSKVLRNLLRLSNGSGVQFYAPAYTEKLSLVEEMAGIACHYGMTLYTCCDEALTVKGVRPAQCVDDELLYELFPHRPKQSKIVPTRKGCNCVQSRDIGAYDTCPHGCVYCYANINYELARKRFEGHASSLDMLLPPQPHLARNRLAPRSSRGGLKQLPLYRQV